MKAVLDACVLYPTITRGLLLDAAAAGVFTPLWSERILAEWTHAAAKDTPQALVEAERVMLVAKWPDALVTVKPETGVDLSLPDPNDTHVLAAALDGGAAMVVTFNLKDFPSRTLGRHGVSAAHPDAFLLSAVEEQPDLRGAFANRLAPLMDQGKTMRDILKRARLPRLGKALAQA
ncbi:MAG: PIN domain-containing protein [Pseudomonadota bacterium]